MGTGQRYYARSRVVKKCAAQTLAFWSSARGTGRQKCSSDAQSDKYGSSSPHELLGTPCRRELRQQQADRGAGKQQAADQSDRYGESPSQSCLPA